MKPECSGACAPILAVDSPIARRTFLVQSALLTAAAALAACGADTTAPTLPANSTVRVSDFSSLSTVGGIAMVTVSGAQLAVVRTDTNSFVALSRVCPHKGSIVNQSGTGFLCPNHGARFSSTGTWQGGERTGNLHSYVTSYDAATGILTIS